MRAAKVARFPGAPGRIPNFTGAERAAERLRGLPAWQAALTVKANPDSAQLPVRQRALEDGKTVYMAVPRLAKPEPFFLLDPGHLDQPPRTAASISGASRSARLVRLDELTPVDLVVMGCVAVGEDGARLGKGGGFADLEFALATAAGLIGPHTVTVTTVHEIQLRPAGVIPLTSHDIALDFIVTPERVIDCRSRHAPRAAAAIRWDDLTEEKIAAIPLLGAMRSGPATTRLLGTSPWSTPRLAKMRAVGEHLPVGVVPVGRGALVNERGETARQGPGVVGHDRHRVEPLGRRGVLYPVHRAGRQHEHVAGPQIRCVPVAVRAPGAAQHDEDLGRVRVGIRRLAAAWLPHLVEDAGAGAVRRADKGSEPDGVRRRDELRYDVIEMPDDGRFTTHACSPVPLGVLPREFKAG